jgi:hypothetical protein
VSIRKGDLFKTLYTPPSEPAGTNDPWTTKSQFQTDIRTAVGSILGAPASQFFRAQFYYDSGDASGAYDTAVIVVTDHDEIRVLYLSNGA